MHIKLSFLMALIAVSSVADSVGLTRAQIERDLRLDVTLSTTNTIGPGEHIGLAVALVNDSKTTAYTVIKQGDGSDVGLREPHVFITAERKNEDNTWETVPPLPPFLICGLLDTDWEKDVVHLGPSESIKIMVSPDKELELQQEGRLRLRVHYRYNAGAMADENDEERTAALGKMEGIPAFEIVSLPIELELQRPLDITVTVKSPMKANSNTRLSDILDIHLVNQSASPIEVSSPTLSGDARLQLQIRGKYSGWIPLLHDQNTTYGTKKILTPGEKVAALGPGEFSNGLDGWWEYPVPDTVELRAVYHCSTWKPSPIVISPWVSVPVNEYNAEQGGPGYPPQSVGSPDP